MKRTIVFATLAVGVCLLAALSCTGGGGGGTGITGASATASVSAGTVTGKGSVDLNGKKYETPSGISYMFDGQPGSFADLKIGMVVTVNGSLSSNGTRTASTVTQEDVVEGVIQSIPPATNDRLVVLGQTVLIDEGTRFDNNITPPNIGGLQVGNLVEVSGFVIDKFVIRATLIEKKNQPANCEVKGIVQNHNTGAQSFTLGNGTPALTVTYTGANISDMPNPAGNAWNDLLVEVKGSPCDQNTVTLNATKVEPERINVANVDDAEVEGAVTRFNSSTDFAVNGVPVVTNANTKFEGGVAGDLALGVEVEVEGSLVNGILTAKEISFRDNVEIEGNVNTIVANDLTVSGLPGITLLVNAQTEFKGGISSPSDIQVGNHVRIKGRPTGPNTVIAAEVEMQASNPDPKVILEGAVQSFGDPSVVVLGFSINTSTITDNNFKGSNGVPNGRAAFFSAIKVGTLVQAQGTLNSGSVVWSEIEIEGEPD